MSTLATLKVNLIGDISSYEAAMTKAEKRAEGWKKFGSNLQSAGMKLTAGVTAPVVGLAVVAVNMASDLEESMSKVNVVFGDNAQAIVDWSKNSATAFGISQQQALEAAGTYGNLLTSMGVYPDMAAEMSTGTVTLASDLASFNNASPEETLLAIRSALTGEFEPMKRYGVVLNQATVLQKALDEGLIKTAEDMTPAIKSQAVYALMLEQTTNAQGDFIRTSDGLANSTRIAKAQFTDAAAAIGQQLLPVAMKIVNVISGWLDRFKNLSPHMQKIIVIVAAVAAAIGPLLMIVGSLIGAFTTIAGVISGPVIVAFAPLILAIGAIIAIIALLALAWKNNWGDIRGKTKAAIDFIKGIIDKALTWIREFWDQHGAQIIAIVQGLWDGVKAIFDWFVGIAKEIFAAFRLAFEGDWQGFGEKLREVWDKVWEAVKTVLSNAWDFIKDAVAKGIQAIIKWFKETDWKEVGMSILKGIASGISAATSWVINAVKNVAKAIWGTLTGFFGIGSPSRLMIDMGENLMRSGAMGISKMAYLMDMAMQGAIGGLSPALNVTVPVGQPVGGGVGTGAPMIVYGGLHLHGVEDGQSLLEKIQEVMI